MVMNNSRNHKYNGAIDRTQITPDKRYSVGAIGKLFVHDIFEGFPKEFLDANVVFIDVPYTIGDVKRYDIKADKDSGRMTYEIFLERIKYYLENMIKLRTVFIEVGKANVDKVITMLFSHFVNVKVYESTYYKKNLCYIVQAWNDEKDFIAIQDSKLDEVDVNENIIVTMDENDVICDFMNGRGLTSKNAFKYGRKFICSDMNVNRLAVAYEDIARKGGEILCDN